MSRYRRRRTGPDASVSGDPLQLPEDIAAGPAVAVWAPDVADRTAAWWTARRRWRDATDDYAAWVGVEGWRVRNACRTRRPY